MRGALSVIIYWCDPARRNKKATLAGGFLFHVTKEDMKTFIRSSLVTAWSGLQYKGLN